LAITDPGTPAHGSRPATAGDKPASPDYAKKIADAANEKELQAVALEIKKAKPPISGPERDKLLSLYDIPHGRAPHGGAGEGGMNLLSASSLQRVDACPASAVLPALGPRFPLVGQGPRDPRAPEAARTGRSRRGVPEASSGGAALDLR
jgi:hypothetical protein